MVFHFYESKCDRLPKKEMMRQKTNFQSISTDEDGA